MSDHPKAIASETSTETLKQSLRHTVEQMSVLEISALIQFAQQTLQGKQEAARDALLAEFRERASGMGLSLEALIAKKSKPGRPASAKAETGKLRVKYRGPSGEEWSGRGRTPSWLAALESEGKKREEYAA